MIPKIIHYCWLSGDPIPEELKNCMDSWKKHLPDYEFMLWNLERFDIHQTLWTQQAFAAKKYAFAADYIRLYAVYTYGGIYMDMDVEVVKSFNHLLSASYILGYETDYGIEAGVFGGEKNALWLKKCLEYYNNRNFVKPDGKFDTKPLPNIMFDCLGEERRKFNIYPNDYFTAKSYDTGVVTKTNNTYSIHHFAGSWVSEEGRYAYQLRNTMRWIPNKWLRGYLAAFLSVIRYKGVGVACRVTLEWLCSHLGKHSN